MNTAAPGPDWKLIARRRLIIGSKIFPAGSQIPVGEVGRNFAALISSGLMWWAPPHTLVTAAAADLPPAPPTKPKPNVLVIEKYPDDPVRNWELTRDRMLKLCGDNAALARDLLESHEGARQLFKLAQRVGVAEEKQKRGVQNLPPNKIGL
jgi:hypothetical protein